jgi:DNA-binding transcriptional ArsR family regulator
MLVMTDGDALEACADPTRRAVLTLLRDGPRSVGEIAAELPVSQSAVSQHLRVLRRAGLVQARPLGTRRLYSVDLGGLGEVRAWFDQFWDDALAAFAQHVDATHGTSSDPGTPQETP